MMATREYLRGEANWLGKSPCSVAASWLGVPSSMWTGSSYTFKRSTKKRKTRAQQETIPRLTAISAQLGKYPEPSGLAKATILKSNRVPTIPSTVREAHTAIPGIVDRTFLKRSRVPGMTAHTASSKMKRLLCQLPSRAVPRTPRIARSPSRRAR